ncbi:unnamed protein product [Camellia sinensis]
MWNSERNTTFEVTDDSPNLIFSLMSKTLLSRIKPRHNPKPSSSPSFSFKPLIKRLVNELCDILKTHHHNQWQDTLETRLSEEEIVPSDIAHLVLDRIRDPELGLKFFDWVTQRPYGCSLDGFAYSSLLKLLASSRVFSEIETVLESMKVEDKLPTWEALDAVIRAYSDSRLVDKALEIYTTVLSTSNSVPSVLACNSLLNALEVLKQGKISKPVVAWVSGTCACLFKSEVQFGHAGAKSGGEMESAQAKNQALHDAGAVVPTSFEAFETVIKETFEKLLRGAMLLLQRKFKPPQIPEDLNTAIKSGKVRAPTHIISTISDDRAVLNFCFKLEINSAKSVFWRSSLRISLMGEMCLQIRIVPSKVVERHFHDIIERYGETVKVDLTDKEVRKQAAASTQRFEEGNPLSILDGIFMAIKDDIDCYPHPSKGATTWFHEVRLVRKDAVCVSRLRKCGVIFVGKANMHELGMGTTGNNPNYGEQQEIRMLQKDIQVDFLRPSRNHSFWTLFSCTRNRWWRFHSYSFFPLWRGGLENNIWTDRHDRVVDALEIFTVIGKIPHLLGFLNSLYDCQYNWPDEANKIGPLFASPLPVYMREVRTVVYSQFLESYESVTIEAMAKAFGVTVEFIDLELSRFIAAGKLHCKIDKVAGVLETNRPDAKNALYQATIKQGDFLLNRIQKLSRVIDLQGTENANTEGIIAKYDTKFNKKFSTDRLSLK